MTVASFPKMPPLGVADLLLGHTLDSADTCRFWLSTHTVFLGEAFWRAAVLRECLPSPDDELHFEALAPVGGG